MMTSTRGCDNLFIGDRLKEARIRKRLSQQQLGDMMKVSKVSICGYEKGNRTPNINNFLQLLEILEVTPDYLLGRDVFAIRDDDEQYTIALANEDLTILNEIKKHPKLYKLLYNDPVRTVELIVRKLNK
ncbi:MAG: helix-turn-helix transcriptional regulator [Bacilli bacterium]|nr:helix-turn-helix transcriptional regulator [Bacilli bacterium]